MNKTPDIMHYTSDYILAKGDGPQEPLCYLGRNQVLSLLGPRNNSQELLESLPPAMELLDGPIRVPIYLWHDVYQLLEKEGLAMPKNNLDVLENN